MTTNTKSGVRFPAIVLASIGCAAAAIGQPSTQGEWSTPIELRPPGFAGPATKAVHSILIPNSNKILCIDQDDAGRPSKDILLVDPLADPPLIIEIWDDLFPPSVPVADQTRFFCAGMALTSNGRVVLVGGGLYCQYQFEKVSSNTAVFSLANGLQDASNELWNDGNGVVETRRYYPTATTLANGHILRAPNKTPCRSEWEMA